MKVGVGETFEEGGKPALAHGPLHMKLVLVDLFEPVFGRLRNESLRRARHGVSDGSVGRRGRAPLLNGDFLLVRSGGVQRSPASLLDPVRNSRPGIRTRPQERAVSSTS